MIGGGSRRRWRSSQELSKEDEEVNCLITLFGFAHPKWPGIALHLLTDPYYSLSKLNEPTLPYIAELSNSVVHSSTQVVDMVHRAVTEKRANDFWTREEEEEKKKPTDQSEAVLQLYVRVQLMTRLRVIFDSFDQETGSIQKSLKSSKFQVPSASTIISCQLP